MLKDLRCSNQSFVQRASFSSNTSDLDRQIRYVEPAYSFVGMHCIFDNCKVSGNFKPKRGYIFIFAATSEANNLVNNNLLSVGNANKEISGYLTLVCSLKLAPRVHNIQASFCPLLSLEKGEFVGLVLWTSVIHYVPLTCLLKIYAFPLFQGHGCAVIGVTWNHGQNFLASSDSDGTVIVWKRAQTS
ncbi:hypothetical protein B296_00030035 [Ensete ventricosum]|uniref:Uncharacterized protein n=1 Tax=Ensete ventricosum TaxID=4639 RepID=A0A426ZSB1_ENSVE|nr:hypothetical protein B296_00030035 [Ensete ventricosum]